MRRYRLAAKQEIPFETSFIPKLAGTVHDYKRTCVECKVLRSFTLMTASDVCGLCCQGGGHHRDKPDCNDSTSHMVYCRTCGGLYAVCYVDGLKVPPKCHYCRTKSRTAVAQPDDVPSISCNKCRNKFVCPDPLFLTKCGVSADVWQCAVCEVGDDAKSFHAHTLELQKWTATCPNIVGCVGLPASVVGSTCKVLSMLTDPKLKEVMLRAPPALLPRTLYYMFFPVRDVPGLLETVEREVMCGDVKDFCNMCCSELDKVKMGSACGKCRNLACNACLKAWYGQVAPGRLLLPSHLLCAFCKRPPASKTLRMYNREAMAVLGSRDLQFKPDMYYAWCMGCYKVVEYLPRDCARDAAAEDELRVRRGILCEPCAAAVVSAQGTVKTVDCPGCGTTTAKSGGCSHMTCPQCCEHWCWECGKGFGKDGATSADKAYSHLRAVHGGLGWGDEDEDEDFEGGGEEIDEEEEFD